MMKNKGGIMFHMRKILLILSAMLIFVTPVYAADAVIPDDDSAQYMPFPPQPV